MGSISAASRASGQTPSAVSKQIGHLEDHVGYRLLRRTRSGVALTDDGTEFFTRCKALADKFNEAEDYISSLNGVPKGQLRIASSVAFGKSQLIRVLPDFLAMHPQIRLSLELTDRRIDIEEDNFDAAISFAEQKSNPNVIVRRIMRNERVLCASPEFIARHGSPESFADLTQYNCLRTSNARGRNAWHADIDGVHHEVEATGNFEGNSADAVLTAALSGLGIARLSTYLVADKIASGALVRLFPDYTQTHADVAVTFAQKRNLSPKIRAFVDFLIDRFTQG